MPSHRTSTPGRAGQRSGTHSTTTGPEAPVGAKAGPVRQPSATCPGAKARRAGQRSGTHSTTTSREAQVRNEAGPARRQSRGGCANNLFSSHEERPNA